MGSNLAQGNYIPYFDERDFIDHLQPTDDKGSAVDRIGKLSFWKAYKHSDLEVMFEILAQ